MCDPYMVPLEDKKGPCYHLECAYQRRNPLVLDRNGQCIPYDKRGHDKLKMKYE